MSLALINQELSFQRRVKAFVQKHIKPLAAKIEVEEFFSRRFLRFLGETGFWEPLSRDPLGVSALAGFVSELWPKRFLLSVQPWKWLG